ncbi:DNA ligase (NAD(+)) LigA [Leptospira gomenensis]|uniref:DNA ligase n=1 Tax=Leptospira gomenensis TaxID=2484974 RepID=A0A5F1Y7H4_9LEPT|nr:NAD-dependent DNA ligase LigA [Leptospira gomenensis]TGK28166.1 DNA ligase (NAD(+)) LigA [Leptospira gomenensis]TGK36980.1 DNA ligase (NAD(+)) LigA [Leptospira gomenensis]TGK45616.1 DNA ligase (NAD(+)) LigA [Leptospira gomenensis]TGK59555.1 DNA ligase (NAD(+)) LigA [Leptospira gomenensis]
MAKKKTNSETDLAEKDAKAEIDKLSEEIRLHQYLYYVKNKAKISDLEFDRLFRRLQDLEEKFPQFKDPASPTLVVGSDLDKDFEKFQHKLPVLSLINTYNEEELLDWVNKTDPEGIYSVEWKIDGASIVLYYENGILRNGVTRGSGGIGDDVTDNVKTIRNIPLRLPEDLTVHLRGEVFMTFKDFDEYNESSSGKYANPRNLSAGSIKQKNSSETAKRPLRIFTYDAVFPDISKKFKTHQEIISKLEKLTFPVPPDTVFVVGSKIAKTIKDFKKKKDKLGFPTDGLVIKLNDVAKRDALGYTSHSPRWARAYKFDAVMKESRIVDITYAVGRTGKITPRAEIEPISLAGTTVTFATLHNQDYIDELGIGIGAVVRVAKRGEIIPAVEEVVTPGKEIFKIPDRCPSCKTKTIKKENLVDLFCPNPDCPDRVKNGIIFFCQRKQMDIEGLGEKQVEFLYDREYVKSIADLYDLKDHKEKLMEEEGFGEKSVAIILGGIEQSKQKDFRFVLPSIGLPEIGHKVTELLIEHGIDSMDQILSISKDGTKLEALLEIPGIGPSTVEAFRENFADKRILKLIERLKKSGLKLKADPVRVADRQPFAGQSWCVTGSFENFQPRDKAMDLIAYYGGRKVSAVSSKTTHLLAGPGAGSKLEKANELGIEIYDEPRFLELLKSLRIDPKI